MRITDFKHVSVFILRVNIIKKPQVILVVLKNFKQIKEILYQITLFPHTRLFKNAGKLFQAFAVFFCKAAYRWTINIQNS